MTVEAFAPAKVNLALHVTGRRSDGYHLLDSLVAFADVGDRVALRRAEDWSLAIDGPEAVGIPSDDGNLCLRAGRLTDGPPAAITLTKRLPMAAGIGGGSADAAAVLRALQALDGRPLPSNPERLGADVPVCLHGRAARMRGIGEEVVAVPALPPLHACLVNPGIAVPTPAVFAALEAAGAAPMPDPPRFSDAADCAAWLGLQRNDLEAPARGLAPAIGVVLSVLSATRGCRLARMSGSGATCFGLYAAAPDAAAAADDIRARRPGWWVRAAALR